MHSNRPSILRNFAFFSVGTSDIEIAPPNDRRIAMIISPPPLIIGNGQPLLAEQHNTSIAATGITTQLTVPVGQNYHLDYASYFVTAGSPATVALQIQTGGNTITLQTLAGSGVYQNGIDLQGGDIIQFNVTVLGAGGTADFVIALSPQSSNSRVTLSYQNPAVLDHGINLYAGQQQYILDWGVIGQSIREDIHAVANIATTIIGVLDIFTSCPCELSEVM